MLSRACVLRHVRHVSGEVIPGGGLVFENRALVRHVRLNVARLDCKTVERDWAAAQYYEEPRSCASFQARRLGNSAGQARDRTIMVVGCRLSAAGRRAAVTTLDKRSASPVGLRWTRPAGRGRLY